jgi:transposase-like protein
MSDLSRPEFHDAEAARQWLENELWPDGPICPHCGTINDATLLQHGTKPRKVETEKKKRPHRAGLYQCNSCREPFTVTVGTLYERSHVPLNKWLAATHLLMASKKGMSALQIGRLLGLSKKTAWFVCHRIRESLPEDLPLKGGDALGGKNKVVEIDETFVGGRAENQKGKIPPKAVVLSLVERDGRVRSRHVADVTGRTLREAIVTQVDRASYIMTDEAPQYRSIGREFGGHGRVNHSAEEYVRASFYHTNTVEGYFAILKRGIVGVYHHTSKEHLHRYLYEFDYRFNNREALGIGDSERMRKSIKGIVGRRLTYRRPSSGTNV